MQVGSLHVDLIGLAQVLLGVAAIITAWRGRNAAKGKSDASKQAENGK